jgi:hypothetical protein
MPVANPANLAGNNSWRLIIKVLKDPPPSSRRNTSERSLCRRADQDTAATA